MAICQMSTPDGRRGRFPSGENLMTESLPIRDEEWNFGILHEKQTREAMVWEYCRSQEWIKEAAVVRRRKSDASTLTTAVQTGLARKLDVAQRPMSTDAVRQIWSLPPPEKPAATQKSDTVRVVEIWAERSPRAGRVNPFIDYELHIMLGPGFPKFPYALAPRPLAVLEHFDVLHLAAVHDLEVNSVTTTLSPTHLLAANSEHSQNIRFHFSEKNGLPVEVAPNEAGWRKFALAIDWSRTDEEIQLSFREFLKAARKKYDLPSTIAKSSRPGRGGVPNWLTVRYATEHLEILGAHRLIEQFDGDAAAAFQHYKQRLTALKRSGPYVSVKEMKRAAARFPLAVGKMFLSDPARQAGRR